MWTMLWYHIWYYGHLCAKRFEIIFTTNSMAFNIDNIININHSDLTKNHKYNGYINLFSYKYIKVFFMYNCV